MGEQTRILIVDDDEKVLFIMHATLDRLGNDIEIATADNGHMALEMIKDNHFDLIISDVRMPGIDGIALVEKIREWNMDTAVVWITAYGCKVLQPDSERLNVSLCLEKPLRIGEFRDAIANVLTAVIAGGKTLMCDPVNKIYKK